MKFFLIYMYAIACLILGLYCLGNHAVIAFFFAMINIAEGLTLMVMESVKNRFPDRYAF